MFINDVEDSSFIKEQKIVEIVHKVAVQVLALIIAYYHSN